MSNVRVTLIHKVQKASRSGPINGMHALQQALRRERERGELGWLAFGDVPVDGSIPWIWCWRQRELAAKFARQRRPFILGPNVLFHDSRRPRYDEIEIELLDADSCEAIFCHSAWYRDLLRKHMGPRNQANVWCWPYPVAPLPGPPQYPAEFELLVFVKSGPDSEHIARELTWFFKRVRILRYGEFQRTELYSLAKSCRSCLYLSDDESGGLVTQELMLAGCPVVGIRRGAPLLKHGQTGIFVEDWGVEHFVPAILETQTFDRRLVRAKAMQHFDSESIARQVIQLLREVWQRQHA